MTPTILDVSYSFYPVGQGLFSSGRICNTERPGDEFVWVYDCGTISKQALLLDQIEVLEQDLSRKHIDVLVISHFDKDHISGVCQLLSKFSVGILLLPYIPLWQRLVLAFSLPPRVTGDLIDFLVNPTRYLERAANGGIQRMLYVRPGRGREGQVVDDDENLDVTVDAPLPTYFRHEEPPPDVSSGGPTAVSVLPAGSAIRVDTFWEFVPHNDQQFAPRGKSVFVDAVERHRAVLLGSGGVKRDEVLGELKRTYNKQYKTSHDRNVISLFLYGGPILGSMVGTCECLRSLKCRCPFSCLLDVSESRKGAVLYTGDGYLDTEERLTGMIEAFSETRVSRIHTFQVMHHGARSSWHAGIAGRLNPTVSVFSSDPTRRDWRHPNQAVLREFWEYGAVQVDKRQGYASRFCLFLAKTPSTCGSAVMPIPLAPEVHD